MTLTTIDFYLDFMSPFSYLAHHRLLQIKQVFGLTLRYHPIDLPRVKIAVGNSGPSNRAIPAKIAYLSQDMQRWAQRYEIPLTVPGSHDSKLANIGLLVAIDRNLAAEYAGAVWQRTWGSGGDFASLHLLGEVATELGWEVEAFLGAITSSENESRYQAQTDSAVSSGVFGVPIMVIDQLMWWGNDRLFMMEEYLKNKQQQETG